MKYLIWNISFALLAISLLLATHSLDASAEEAALQQSDTQVSTSSTRIEEEPGDDDDDDDDNGDDDDDDDDQGGKQGGGGKTKGGKDLDDSQLATVQGEKGDVICGEIKTEKWVPGVLKRGLFFGYQKLFKIYRRLAREDEGNRGAERKARNNKKKHLRDKNLCASLAGGGNGGGGSGGGGSGSGGGGNSEYIVFDSSPGFNYGNGIFTSAYRAYLGGEHVFTIAIGKGNSQEKAYHAAEIGLQYLDNNEDGTCDNAAVCSALNSIAASGAILFVTETQSEQMGEPIAAGQPLYPNETVPDSQALVGGTSQSFDHAMEEVLHYLTDNGWGKAYPSIFGSSASSTWGQYVTAAINASVYDPTASGDTESNDYATTVPESLYWVITSRFGAQDFSWRIPDVQQEWKSYNATLLSQNVPNMVALIEDPQYGFPLNRPDAVYAPAATP